MTVLPSDKSFRSWQYYLLLLRTGNKFPPSEKAPRVSLKTLRQSTERPKMQANVRKIVGNWDLGYGR